MMEANIHFPKGFRAWGVSAGIKVNQSLDMGILISSPASRTFGAFTTNKFSAASVDYCRKKLQSGVKITHLLVNSGNANACTGEQGNKDLHEMIELVRANFKDVEEVLASSTGIIGQLLPMEKVRSGITKIAKRPGRLSNDSFARAIITTDTVIKTVQDAMDFDGSEVRIGGVAKGAGMICPQMATMLAYLTTDLALPASYKKRFRDLVERSFNSISVDGDMSTNDTVLLLSNGASGVTYSSLSKKDKKQFDNCLSAQFESLAKQIVRDGEGATKLIQIDVSGAVSKAHAKMLGRAVANSPLVKTAFFGRDPNWGRIVAAMGSQPAVIDPGKLDLFFCGVQVLCRGKLKSFNRTALYEKLTRDEIHLKLDLNIGKASWTYWTCDLTYDYIKINADYHT
ncbi:bifunctional glutamate N-acetyltransferase/amino-acid acetyltransferase ArgJ [Fibrobacterota bacterium]